MTTAKINVFLEESLADIRWVGQCLRCKAIHCRSTFDTGLANGYGTVGHPDRHGYDSWLQLTLKAPGRPRLLKPCGFPDSKTKGTESCGGMIIECEHQEGLLAALRLGGMDAVVEMVSAGQAEKSQGYFR